MDLGPAITCERRGVVASFVTGEKTRSFYFLQIPLSTLRPFSRLIPGGSADSMHAWGGGGGGWEEDGGIKMEREDEGRRRGSAAERS